MNPIENSYPGTEPDWDSVSIVRADCRRQWDGDLVSLCTLIQPQRSEAETAEFAKGCARDIATWICANGDQFGAEDRFQIVIAWPQGVRDRDRQIIKMHGTHREIEAMASGRSPIELRESWANGLFTQ